MAEDRLPPLTFAGPAALNAGWRNSDGTRPASGFASPRARAFGWVDGQLGRVDHRYFTAQHLEQWVGVFEPPCLYTVDPDEECSTLSGEGSSGFSGRADEIRDDE